MEEDMSSAHGGEGGNVDGLRFMLNRHQRLVRHINRSGHSLLHLACKQGLPDIVDLLLDFSADMGAKDLQGNTPLHLAAAAGHEQCIMHLIDNGCDVTLKNVDEDTAFDVAVDNKRNEAAILILIEDTSVDVTSSGVPTAIQVAFVKFMAERYLSDEAKSGVCLRDDFLRLVRQFTILMAVDSSPVRTFNRAKIDLYTCMRKLCQQDDPNVFDVAVHLWVGLMKASKARPSEELELMEYAADIERFILLLFNCDAFDEAVKTNELLLNENKTMYEWNSGITLPPTLREAQKDFIIDLFTQRWRKLQLAHVLIDNNILQICLETQMKTVFARSQVSSVLDSLFYSYLNPYSVKPVGTTMTLDTRHVINMPDGRSMVGVSGKVFIFENALAYPRYCPVLMFVVEGCCKLILLILVAYISVHLYALDGYIMYNSGEVPAAINGLVLITGSSLIYSVGSIQDMSWELKAHFSDEWNILTDSSILLITTWAALLDYPEYYLIGRVFLSLSAIPLSLSLLEYLSLINVIGQLVRIIFAMMKDVCTFIGVYIVSVAGFSVAFLALFQGLPQFTDTSSTYLNLFQSTLGEFDFDSFSDSSSYELVGILTLVFFMVLTHVLLLNLLIAQMTNSFERITSQAFAELAQMKAHNVKKHVRVHEKNPLCMLPAPLNIIPALLWVTGLHGYMLEQYNISLGGTVCDYVLMAAFFVPRTIVGSFQAIRDKDIKRHPLLWPFYLMYMLVVVPLQQICFLEIPIVYVYPKVFKVNLKWYQGRYLNFHEYRINFRYDKFMRDNDKVESKRKRALATFRSHSRNFDDESSDDEEEKHSSGNEELIFLPDKFDFKNLPTLDDLLTKPKDRQDSDDANEGKNSHFRSAFKRVLTSMLTSRGKDKDNDKNKENRRSMARGSRLSLFRSTSYRRYSPLSIETATREARAKSEVEYRETRAKSEFEYDDVYGNTSTLKIPRMFVGETDKVADENDEEDDYRLLPTGAQEHERREEKVNPIEIDEMNNGNSSPAKAPTSTSTHSTTQPSPTVPSSQARGRFQSNGNSPRRDKGVSFDQEFLRKASHGRGDRPRFGSALTGVTLGRRSSRSRKTSTILDEDEIVYNFMGSVPNSSRKFFTDKEIDRMFDTLEHSGDNLSLSLRELTRKSAQQYRESQRVSQDMMHTVLSIQECVEGVQENTVEAVEQLKSDAAEMKKGLDAQVSDIQDALVRVTDAVNSVSGSAGMHGNPVVGSDADAQKQLADVEGMLSKLQGNYMTGMKRDLQGIRSTLQVELETMQDQVSIMKVTSHRQIEHLNSEIAVVNRNFNEMRSDMSQLLGMLGEMTQRQGMDTQITSPKSS